MSRLFRDIFSKILGDSNYTLKISIYYVILISPFLLIILKLGFISDDYFLIHSAINNPIQLGANYKNEFSTLYRPIVIFSYYLNYLITKYDANYYYITNLVLHIAASILTATLLRKLSNFILYSYGNKLAFWGGAFFLLCPQNIANILWIPGRSDIICGIFVFSSLISFINYLKFQKKYFIFWAITWCILGFLTKESTVIVNFYLILLLFILKKNSSLKLNTKAILVYPILTILYLTFRYAIFSNNLFGNQINYLTLNLLIKQFLYGSFSLLIPLDILDCYYLLINYNYLTIFFSFFILIGLIFSIKSYWKKHFNIKIVIVSVLLALLSLSIYILSSFPQMRLMYLHLPFIIISFSIMIFNLTQKIKRSVLVVAILVLFGGNILLIQSVYKIDDYTKSLITSIQKENISQNYSYYLIPTLSRVSQRWSVPYIKNLSNYAINGSMDSIKTNFFESIYLETYSLEKIYSLIKYIGHDSSSFYIEVNDSLSGLVYSPSKKNLISEVVLEDSLIKFTLTFDQTLRKGFAKMCKVELLPETNEENIYIIFSHKKKLWIQNIRSFLSFINNLTE